MIKEKCDRCGSPLGTESKKTKERFCGNCDIMIVFEEHFDGDALHCIRAHILKGKNYS